MQTDVLMEMTGYHNAAHDTLTVMASFQIMDHRRSLIMATEEKNPPNFGAG